MVTRRNGNVAALVVVVLAAVVVVWGVYLVAVGLDVPFVSEDAPGSGITRAVADPRGWIPIWSGAAILIGLVLHQRWLCWLGLAATAIFAFVLLFSVGGVLVPVVAALALSLLVTGQRRSAAAT